MYCPQCSNWYPEDARMCPDCQVDLTTGPADEPPHPNGPLVQVYRTADSSLLPVIESVLMGAGIDFLVQGEEGHGLFPLGAIGGGPDQRFLGAIVKVREDDAEKARKVLEEVPDEGTGEEEGGEEAEEE